MSRQQAGGNQRANQANATRAMPPMPQPGGAYGMPPPPPPLPRAMPHPSGWTQHPGPTGQPYYYNTFTRQSTWKRPPELDQPLPMRMPPPPPPPPPHPYAYAMPPNAPPMTTMTMSGPPAGQDTKPKAKSGKDAKKDKAKRMTPIPGTHWKLVKTAEGREFYYDTETKKSFWTMPEEIAEAVAAMKAAERESAKRKISDAMDDEEQKKDREEEEDREEEAESTKRPKIEAEEEEAAAAAAAANTEYVIVANCDAATSTAARMTEEDIMFQLQAMEQEEAEQQQRMGHHRESSIPPEAALSYEERVVLFKALLEESNITAFSLWDKELPKMASDPRYLLIPSVKQRKDIFDDYCRQLASKPKGVVVGRKKTSKEKYQALLEQHVTATTRWLDFSRKHKRDSRFNAIDAKEAERLFEEYVKALKEGHRAEAGEKNKVKEAYVRLLRETRRIDHETSWREAKRMIERDDRYHDVASVDDREDWFYEYRRELEKRWNEDKQRREREEKERERRRKEEASLRERERMVRRERSQLDREAKNQRAMVDKEDATRLCQTLFIDKIKDHTMTWSDAQPELHRDKRFERCVEVLGLRDMEELYQTHVDTTYRARERAFFDMIEEQVPLSAEWPEAKEQVMGREPTVQLKLKEDQLAALFTRHHAARVERAKQDLQTLLEKNAFIEFHAREGTLTFDTVVEVLQEDQQYLQLAFMADERDEIVRRYIEELIAKVGRKPAEQSDGDDHAAAADVDDDDDE
ncbi:hypothetical protein SYNPS1DRAFT_26545 [Syncephalis pseudoplumigaleata]|uniref:WW domain-containing protein n=1 Tax=Syncephalis pseudoplumigaleata TaxID=1712513 RepID=A0A4P9Z5C5_9FUNG|nr:hypothetical protein SYNPS1DRAFT_26545 [Syncephalis pseudoplumigaleata]|eukprot:RKP27813.1 hypothetical protein SYNPS1DRAFT_26545 [Syncephalis pseudoplumigaleata]